MTSPLKIVVTDYVYADMDWEVEQMDKRNIDFTYHQLKFAPESDVIQATKDADIIVVNMVQITPTLIDSWTRCKMVIRHGAGYDNVDVDALTKRGILLEYMPDYCADEVAEHAIALLFACARKIVWSRKVLDDSVARGQWDFKPIMPMYRLDGATLGILGCGRIGSLVFKKLKHFGFNFIICDPYISEKRRAKIDAPFVDIKTLCKDSDYITVHTPLNNETRHIVNAQFLSSMKPSAYLINTSRGPMVDHPALAQALKANTIAGAAIDVYDKEPPEPAFELLDLDNIILTPHLSWYSVDAEWSIREKIVQAIDMFIAGTSPRCAVNPEVLENK